MRESTAPSPGRNIRFPDAMGLFDFNKALEEEKFVFGYAWAEFESPKARNAQIRVSSYNALKIWLNGKLIDQHKGLSRRLGFRSIHHSPFNWRREKTRFSSSADRIINHKTGPKCGDSQCVSATLPAEGFCRRTQRSNA